MRFFFCRWYWPHHKTGGAVEVLRIDDVTDKPSARGQFDWLDMRLTDKLRGSGMLLYDRVQQANSAQDAWLLIYGEYHPERVSDPQTRREELDKARGVFAHSMAGPIDYLNARLADSCPID